MRIHSDPFVPGQPVRRRRPAGLHRKLEPEDPHQKDKLLFRGRSTTAGEMPPASEIERVLAKQCAGCLFVNGRGSSRLRVLLTLKDIVPITNGQ